jgi:hypothetical protein
VDSALHLRIIKKAEPVCFASDIDFPMLPDTAGFDEDVRGQTQESRDFFDLVILDHDPAFAVAAGSTLLAFEGFQQKCLKLRKANKPITKTRNRESTKENKMSKKKVQGKGWKVQGKKEK